MRHNPLFGSFPFDGDWHHHGYQHMFAYHLKSLLLPVLQLQTAAYRTRGHHDERYPTHPEENDAVKHRPVLPPPYRSSSHK